MRVTGQPREQKTAKWAIRERQVNPLVKLLSASKAFRIYSAPPAKLTDTLLATDIEFTISVSDSDSSSVSEGGDDSDTTRAYRAHAMRRRKRTFNKQYGLQVDAEHRNGSEIKATWENDIEPLVMNQKGKGRAIAGPRISRDTTDNSATEDSGDDDRIRPEEEGVTPRVQGKKYFIQSIVAEDSESDLSDDISPLADPTGYSAQLARRAARRNGGKVST